MKKPPIQKRKKPLWIKILLSLIAVAFLLIVSGVAFEAIASHQGKKHYPPEGKLVDAGGFKLHLHQQGEGKPTVLFETGSGMASYSWGDVPKELSRYGTVVTYDRGGYAWSEEPATERTGTNIVKEFYAALQREHITGPYILVGHSLGGMYSRLFAKTYPDDVSGLVLLDSRPEDYSKETDPFLIEAGLDPLLINSPSADLLALLKRVGVLRLMENWILTGQTENEQNRAMNIELQPKFFHAQEQELRNRTRLEDSIRGQNLGDIPLTIITRGVPSDATAFGVSPENSRKMEEIWQEQQRQLLHLSTNSKLIVAEKSGHFIAADEPDLVFNAIKEQIERTR